MSKKETFINLFVSVASNIVILVMGLVIPRVFLTHFGSDTNGLISTISQIFAYVALLEAGISQATTNALYKPLRECNQKDTITVLCASRKYYRKVTHVYAVVVVVLAFILPLTIKSSLDYKTIFLVVLFEGAAGVVSFYFVQTQSILLTADGKAYIKSSIELIIKVLGYGAKIVLALLDMNIVYIQFAFFVLSLLKLTLYKIIMKKKYSWIDYSECTNTKFSLPNRKDFIVSELAWTVFSSTDLIILSFFASTQMASVYSVNNMLFLAVNSMLSAAYYAIYYMLGKAYYSGIEKYTKVHDVFNSFFIGAITLLISVAVLLSDAFIMIYTSGVKDIQYNWYWLPLGFGLIQLLSWSRYIPGNLTGIAGYARQVSRISLFEAIVNLILSIVLVNKFGVYGVVFATIIVLPIKVIYTNYISDKVIMKRSCKNTIYILLANYIVFGVTIYLRFKIVISIHNFIDFILYGMFLTLIYGFIIGGVNIVVNHNLRILLQNYWTGIRDKMLLRKK